MFLCLARPPTQWLECRVAYLGVDNPVTSSHRYLEVKSSSLDVKSPVKSPVKSSRLVTLSHSTITPVRLSVAALIVAVIPLTLINSIMEN